MYKQPYKNALKFEAMLEASGATFDQRIAKFGQGYASSDKYNFRYSRDEVQVGLKSNFDKWGNSQDFVCSPLPCTQENFDAMLTAISKHQAENRVTPEYGGVEIWPFVRKERRARRNEARISACREKALTRNRNVEELAGEPT